MKWRQLTDDVAVMSFPWRAFGIDFERNVSLLRLRDGRVAIHSSAPFTAEDITAIRRFGDGYQLCTILNDARLLANAAAAAVREARGEMPQAAAKTY